MNEEEKHQLLKDYTDALRKHLKNEDQVLDMPLEMEELIETLNFMNIFVNLCLAGTTKKWAIAKDSKYMTLCYKHLKQLLSGLKSINIEDFGSLQETILQLIFHENRFD